MLIVSSIVLAAHATRPRASSTRTRALATNGLSSTTRTLTRSILDALSSESEENLRGLSGLLFRRGRPGRSPVPSGSRRAGRVADPEAARLDERECGEGEGRPSAATSAECSSRRPRRPLRRITGHDGAARRVGGLAPRAQVGGRFKSAVVCGDTERAPGRRLLAEGEVLEGELGTGAECRAHRAEEAQEQGEHGWMMHDGTCCLPCL
jgi:hypothetical protein